MTTVSFKERVRLVAIQNAQLYKEKYLNYEFLVCSEAFVNNNGHKIIKFDEGNYLHLLGVHTSLTANEFFGKCINGTLLEDDFDFIKPFKSEKSVKGSVRQKINVLPEMMNLFTQQLLAENEFRKNVVDCAFATANSVCTLGFAISGRPKTLLKGNELNLSKARKVDLISN